MTASSAKKSLYETLTTPPPPRPAPKQPPFGPQHLVGAGILALGIWGITKLFIRAAQKHSAENLREAEQGTQPPYQAPPQTQDQAMVQNGPERGQYGYRP